MNIERTYIFNSDEYIKSVGNYDIGKESFEVMYAYINKKGKKESININIKLLKDGSSYLLLGNDISIFNNNKNPFAKIIFKNTTKYSDFVMPKWLNEFEYVE